MATLMKPSENIVSQSCCTPQFSSQVSPCDLSIALIREFLAARGLEKTLVCFKTEVKNMPSISSRAALATHLNITKAVASNKTADMPFETYLEILIDQILTRTAKLASKSNIKSRKESIMQSNSPHSSTSSTCTKHTKPTSSSKERPFSAVSALIHATTPSEAHKSIIGRHISNQHQTCNNLDSTLSIQDIDIQMQEIVNRKVDPHSFTTRQSTSVSPLPDPSSFLKLSTNRNNGGLNSRAGNPNLHTDIQIIDDLEFSDEETTYLDGPCASAWNQSQGSRISPYLANELKKLLFLNENVRGRWWFGDEWRNKGFIFQDKIDLAYGLVQVKGGPCGLLASVQAFVIKHLLHSKDFSAIKQNRLRPTRLQSNLALAHALADMIWQAGQTHHRATVVISLPDATLADTITDGMEYHTFDTLKATKDFIDAHIDQFMSSDTRSNGIIQFLFSLILSRSVSAIQQDMDDPDGKLMGRHGYCTQDMVNLALNGVATSNVHDGNIDLGNETILKGIKKQSVIGQLSLFEHYNNIKVGEFMKIPILPIFVICSESHYTTLFSLNPVPKSRQELQSIASFELFYYDGLANQQEEIRLTVMSMARHQSSTTTIGVPKNRTDLIPPLELCIRTKWIDCVVDWNGTEPLL
ncbi:hypothetical protein QVD99_008356 [Batrachochytrium dendrobatidis]|nr:hypothetical protein QVD99_008356 [Batrachochytrium dendrobatidis]